MMPTDSLLLHPAAWPWPILLVGAGLILACHKSIWKWIKTVRATNWSTAVGKVQYAEFDPSFDREGPFISELGYSFCVEGTQYNGSYQRRLPNPAEAEDFTRGIRGKPVLIHYNPSNPAVSILLEPEVDRLLQGRPPSPSSPSPGTQWPQSSIRVLAILSVIGLAVSLCVHIGALLGKDMGPDSLFVLLHLGMLALWFTSIFIPPRSSRNLVRRLKDCPAWARYMVQAFGAYAFVSFLIFLIIIVNAAHKAGVPPTVWGGFSGHWMFFSSAAFATTLTKLVPKAPSRNPDLV